ncbi:MAG: CBS domain-containing protein [Candidatus Bipolaricaulota bacterium]|nr:CBS domain-containing protein [Candidatus Bipolaricaulota bacterium]MDW8126213.1 CBS domain-containing protein [Candidatus Bipolaricaulota bacterium]
MKVRDFVRRDLTAVERDTRVSQAIKLLENSGLSSLPVVDDEGKVVGVISERDIIRALLPEYVDMLRSPSFLPSLDRLTKKLREIGDHPIERYMVKEVISVRLEDTDLYVADLMLRKGLKQLPVVDEQGRLVGVVRRIDLLSRL